MRKWCEPTAIYNNGETMALLKKVGVRKYCVSFGRRDTPLSFEDLQQAVIWLEDHDYKIVKLPHKKYDVSRYVPPEEGFVPRPEIRKHPPKQPLYSKLDSEAAKRPEL